MTMYNYNIISDITLSQISFPVKKINLKYIVKWKKYHISKKIIALASSTSISTGMEPPYHVRSLGTK